MCFPDESGSVPKCPQYGSDGRLADDPPCRLRVCPGADKYHTTGAITFCCLTNETPISPGDICLPRVRLYKAEINELKEKQARLEAALDRARKMAQYASSPNEAIIYTPAFEWNELVELIDRAMGNV